MMSYAALHVFRPMDEVLLGRAQQLIEFVPTYDPKGELVRCHELARAVGRMLGLQVQDGLYGFVEHSWLWLSSPEADYRRFPRYHLPKILDVYVPGSLPQVQLVDTASGLCHRYLPTEPRTDIVDDTVDWLYRALQDAPPVVVR